VVIVIGVVAAHRFGVDQGGGRLGGPAVESVDPVAWGVVDAGHSAVSGPPGVVVAPVFHGRKTAGNACVETRKSASDG
jgi:hypothetical protein